MSKKSRDNQFTEAQLVKELKSCMRCKYFWGNNNRCANGACQKKSGKEIKKIICQTSVRDVLTTEEMVTVSHV